MTGNSGGIQVRCLEVRPVVDREIQTTDLRVIRADDQPARQEERCPLDGRLFAPLDLNRRAVDRSALGTDGLQQQRGQLHPRADIFECQVDEVMIDVQLLDMDATSY